MKSLAKLLGGTAAAQLVALAIAPFLTRLYTPAEFGELTVFASTVAILSVVAGLRYEMAIPIAKSRGEALNLLMLVVAIVLGTTVIALTTVVTWFIYALLTSASPPPRYSWLIPVAVLAAGLYAGLANFVLREKRYGLIAKSRIVQALASAALQLGLPLWISGAWGLLSGSIMSTGGGVLTLGTAFRRNLRRGRSRISLKRVIAAARSHYRYPCFSTPHGLLNAASSQLPVLVLAVGFSSPELGLLGLALRMCQAPMAVVGQAIGQLYLSGVGEQMRSTGVGEYTGRYLQVLISASLPSALVVSYYIPQLAESVFGTEWRSVGVVVQLLLPWMVTQFVTAPLASTVAAANRQFGGLVSQGMFLVARVLAAGFGIHALTFHEAVLLLSIVSSLCYLGFCVWVVTFTRTSVRSLLRAVARATSLGATVGGVMMGCGLALSTHEMGASVLPWVSLALAVGIAVTALVRGKLEVT